MTKRDLKWVSFCHLCPKIGITKRLQTETSLNPTKGGKWNAKERHT